MKGNMKEMEIKLYYSNGEVDVYRYQTWADGQLVEEEYEAVRNNEIVKLAHYWGEMCAYFGWEW